MLKGTLHPVFERSLIYSYACAYAYVPVYSYKCLKLKNLLKLYLYLTAIITNTASNMHFKYILYTIGTAHSLVGGSIYLVLWLVWKLIGPLLSIITPSPKWEQGILFSLLVSEFGFFVCSNLQETGNLLVTIG